MTVELEERIPEYTDEGTGLVYGVAITISIQLYEFYCFNFHVIYIYLFPD